MDAFAYTRRESHVLEKRVHKHAKPKIVGQAKLLRFASGSKKTSLAPSLLREARGHLDDPLVRR
jgi:hypothetical protein